MSLEDSAYHSQSQGASTPQSEISDSGIKEGSLDDSIKLNSSTLNGYNTMSNHLIKSDGHLIPRKDSSIKTSEHKHSNSSSHHNSDHIKKKDSDSSKHSSSSSKHKDDVNKINKSSNSISSKEHHDKKPEHSKEKSSSEKSSHENSSKKIDKHKEKSKDAHSSSGHSEHKHKDHKSKGDHKSKEHDKSKDASREHDKSKHDSSKDKVKKVESHKDKHGDKPKEKSDKDRTDRPKDKSDKDRTDKPKDKSDKPKEKSDKPKEKIDKPKEKSDKPKERSEDKHKERSENKHKEKSEHKHKESSDKSKEKSDKPKEKSDKPKEKSDKPKDKTDRPKEKSDKPKEKSDKPKEKSDKPKEKSDKSKDKIEKTKDKSNVEKRESSPDKKHVQIKQESKKVDKHKQPKVEMSVTVENIDQSEIKMELDEDSSLFPRLKIEYSSEDDIPLSARKPVKEEKPEEMHVKREIESDDEPLSARVNKTKKIKTEQGSAKKRKGAESDYDDDYNDDADEDYDSDYKKPSKKKAKKETKPKKTSTKTKEEITSPTSSPTKKGRAKKEPEGQDVWKWWEEEKHEGGTKWRTLEHKGPVFAPAYERVPKSVKFFYDGKHMPLSEVTEEVAGFYGRMLDHDYVTKEQFNTNFFKDWRKVMTAEEREKINDLKKCNFNAFNDYYKMKSEERKAMTKEQKQEIKKQNEALVQEYGFCVIDGHRQKIGNFKIEPPGLFRGRGEHPKMGMLKRRVQPEDILINIGKEATIPEAPSGHKWKEVRHDNTVTWLCSWNENILGSTKYIMLNPSSKLKGEKDWAKYETARKLKTHADRIRRTYSDEFKSKEMKIRQRAVALYFIDKLALRAGNEKDEDTADTVGCCSLRVEHITLDEEKDGQDYVVSFDFLGKDSIRYFNTVPVEKRAFKNLKLFMENKQPGDDLFDRLNTSILNKYLNELMEGLTAKVFRTYNASKTLQEQLDLLTKEDMSLPEKLLAYNRANRAVAILCNHQRAVPKTFNKSMEALKTKIDDKIQQIRACKKDIKQLKSDSKNSGNAKDKMLLDKKKKRLAQLEDQLKKLEVQATDKEENKQIALGTSKLNYLDPRISVAWCKKWDVPIEKIYNRTQRDKFRWAIEMAGPEFHF